MSIVSEFLSDRRQCVHFNAKISASVDVVSGVFQGSVLEPMLFILCSSQLFHIVGNHIVRFAINTTICAVIPRPVSRPQVLKLLNLNLTVTNSWCLKRHMLLNHKKTKSTVVRGSRTIAIGYGNLTLSGADIEEAKSLYSWGYLRV